ncbi:glycerophosphoryl diester phosphodiesterase [Bacillus pakistanensis]|uniref:Glycerophosphoryl diester phosphodiesterase n=1 Tax=Rossellomorea pakistanensis TaxID=992288 RepID=A0ABS2NJS2_9BACI|nr:glycerophosphoryl diester phosphodiesterase [Bacillus pakistanensis]
MKAQIPFSPTKKKKKSIIVLLLFLLAGPFIIANSWKDKKLEEKPFFKNEGPLVIAHQGGELLTPSNTMAAFKKAAEMGVDVLETDIHITKDGHLVTIHDPTVDRTTNGKGFVADLTLKEVQELDAGYYFKDLQGNYSYRNKGVQIPTVEEVFQQFPNLRIEIEIKDDNPPERLKEISNKLWQLIKKYNKEEQVLVASFDQEIIELFKTYSHEKTAVASGKQEVTKFVLLQKLFLPGFYRPQADVHQIPTQESIFDLSKKSLIKGAHRHGVTIHYWTIDDKKTMRQLLDAGADGILTNRPDLLLEVLHEMGY